MGLHSFGLGSATKVAMVTVKKKQPENKAKPFKKILLRILRINQIDDISNNDGYSVAVSKIPNRQFQVVFLGLGRNIIRAGDKSFFLFSLGTILESCAISGPKWA